MSFITHPKHNVKKTNILLKFGTEKFSFFFWRLLVRVKLVKELCGVL